MRTKQNEDKTEESLGLAERKRKGKHAATSRVKKSKQTTEGKSVEAPLPAPTKVPFAKERVGHTPESESEEEERDEPEEVLNFEPAEVWITKGLLEGMGKFGDPKRTTTYKERCGSGKLAMSGKWYVREELEEIDSDEEFRQYIGAIGFDWLLKHSDTEVPTALAREFFSTFRLKPTTDLDVDSITFQLFTEEHEMSLRDWSLRLGLFTRAEDDDGIWNERVVGPPKYTPGFKPQSAWEFVTHPKVGQFKRATRRLSISKTDSCVLLRLSLATI